VRVGTSAVDLAIRRKNSEEVGKCDDCELCPPAIYKVLSLLKACNTSMITPE
jgi:tRNA/tmRNA/rRNA uracil-C5-methylase (TrmA/RlmC/RlmD family)